MPSSTSFLNNLLSGIIVCCLICSTAGAGMAPTNTALSIALFPMENLSGAPAPLMELNAEFGKILEQTGLHTVNGATIEDFINNHRVRYLGGIDEKTAALLNAETGADYVLITSLEYYNDVAPPKVSLISRLVSLNGIPEIVWMKSIGIAGDDAPGILGLGLINDIKELRGKGLNAIGTSLDSYVRNSSAQKKPVNERGKEEDFTLGSLIKEISSEKRLLAPQQKPDVEDQPQTAEDKQGAMTSTDSRYSPVGLYNSREIPANHDHTIAIIPFFNRSTRKHAAELQALHLAGQLVEMRVFRVLEPGVIRDRMLNMHVIMNSGVSLPNIDLITISLGADLLLNGVVFDYLDTAGYGSNPRVDFSLQIFNREDKKILWSSHSSNQGDDGAYFFDYGRITTAAALSDKMCRALVQRLADNAGTN